jgi:hypothetical protein
MAEFTVTIPDAQLPRIIATYKHRIQEGEAADPENPTGLEIKALLERISLENIIVDVKKHEAQANADSFIFEDLASE